MARRGAALPTIFALGLLLLAGDAAAQPLASRVGGMLLTLTSAINTVRDFRNTTRAGRTAKRGDAAPAELLLAPQPVSADPFSVRVLKVEGSGGPIYEWSAATTASPPNVSVPLTGTANVTFTTRYRRTLGGFSAYALAGALEVRNTRSEHVQLEGPVKVLVTLRRPSAVTTGPQVVETTHYAACGAKGGRLTVPARRGAGRTGVLRCTFEAVLPQAALMMEAAEAALAAAAANASSPVPSSPLLPDVTVVASARAATLAVSAEEVPYASAAAASAPYRATFSIPDRSCVSVSESLTGALAKYAMPLSGSELPKGSRTICGAATVAYSARLGGFDTSACGEHKLTNGASSADVGSPAATVLINVSGCNRTSAFGRPDVAIAKLTAARLLNHTWSADTAALPVNERRANASAVADPRSLQLLPGAASTANFTLSLVKSPAADLGNFLMGDITITSRSLVPDVLQGVRIAITTAAPFQERAAEGEEDEEAEAEPEADAGPAPADAEPAAPAAPAALPANGTEPAAAAANGTAPAAAAAPANATAPAAAPANATAPAAAAPANGTVVAAAVRDAKKAEKKAPKAPATVTTFVDVHCPGTVVIPGLGGLKCTFSIPWNGERVGTVQAQVRSVAAAAFDVTSGTPKAFDFGSPSPVELGACVSVERSYVGETALNQTARPMATLVSGVDALLGSLRVNLTRIGLAKPSFAELLGVSDGPVPPARRLLAEAAAAEAARAALPFLHPAKVSAGAAPPAPGARGGPLTVCGNESISWSEQFAGAPVESCGELYNALSTLTVAPNGTALGAQPALRANTSLPVVVTGCSLRPAVKLLAVRAANVKSYAWSVSAKAQDKGLDLSVASGKPVVARYTVTYNRTESVGNYTLEPAIVLLNPYAKAVPVFSVTATVKVPGRPDASARLRCKGAGANGGLVLPPAPAGGAPVPVGCVGTIALPGPVAGAIVVAADTKEGPVESPPAPFDARNAEVVVSDRMRCIVLDAGFSASAPSGPPVLAPTYTTPSAPKARQQLCEPRKFVFTAAFGPYAGPNAPCGSFAARYVASIAGAKRTAVASTPITVHSCRA
ncbi:hypothetical protein Rsub_03940 [Raphidocelis subcapitata]|uniref:Uncharacterized protein n=1 Tax=Raphidocelis subcapitata TaxID=307507 RepID=A0A2V0NVH5_9CHLO|nr:hypothetical protein Rsub_03940 [Raphidocelis subcapitata]|eukprot:GBF91636.1 hypothetical protein Rsub_03940 [Raphidocelis subcapitata]